MEELGAAANGQERPFSPYLAVSRSRDWTIYPTEVRSFWRLTTLVYSIPGSSAPLNLYKTPGLAQYLYGMDAFPLKQGKAD